MKVTRIEMVFDPEISYDSVLENVFDKIEELLDNKGLENKYMMMMTEKDDEVKKHLDSGIKKNV